MKRFAVAAVLFASTAYAQEMLAEEEEMETLSLQVQEDDVEMLTLRQLSSNATSAAPVSGAATGAASGAATGGATGGVTGAATGGATQAAGGGATQAAGGATQAPAQPAQTTAAPAQAPAQTTAAPAQVGGGSAPAQTTAAPAQGGGSSIDDSTTSAPASDDKKTDDKKTDTQSGGGDAAGSTAAAPKVTATVTPAAPAKKIELPAAFADAAAAASKIDALLSGGASATSSLALSAADEKAAVAAISTLAAPAEGEAVVKVHKVTGVSTAVPVDIDPSSPVELVVKVLEVSIKFALAKAAGLAPTNYINFKVVLSARRLMEAMRRRLAGKTATSTYDIVIIEDASKTGGVALTDIVGADGAVKAPVITAADLTAANENAVKMMKEQAAGDADALALLAAVEGAVAVTGDTATSGGTVTTVETTAAEIAKIPALAKLEASQAEYQITDAPAATGSSGAADRFGVLSILSAVVLAAVAF